MGGEGEESRHPAAGTSRDMAVTPRCWSLIRQSGLHKLCPEFPPGAMHTGCGLQLTGPPPEDARTDGGLAAVCVIPPGGSWLDTACRNAQQFLAPL